MQGTTAGAIVKRAGLVTFSSPAQTLTSLFAYENAPGSLVGAGNGKLYSINSSGTATQIGSGFNTTAGWEWVQSQSVTGSGPVYGMNGVDTPQQWSGSGNTTNWTASSGTLQNGKYLLLAGNRIWVSGVSSAPQRVYFSDLIPENNGPVNWPSQNVAVFDENDGQPITGLGHLGPYILVCKARKLYVITDFNTGDARRLSDNIGCISHRSIAQAPEGTYFLAEDRGVYLTNGSKITPISDLIQPTIDSIQQRGTAAAAYINGHYYLSVDMSDGLGVNDTVLDFDSALNSWWLHTFGSSQFAIWHPTGSAQLFSAKASGGAIVDKCFVPGTYTDNGTAFKWWWRGPWQSPTFYRRRRFPTPYFKKNFRQIRYDGSGTVDFSLATDFAGNEVLQTPNAFGTQAPSNFGASDGSTFGGLGTFGDFPSITRARNYSLGVHDAISVVFSATSQTADTVTSYVLMVTDRKDMVVS